MTIQQIDRIREAWRLAEKFEGEKALAEVLPGFKRFEIQDLLDTEGHDRYDEGCHYYQGSRVIIVTPGLRVRVTGTLAIPDDLVHTCYDPDSFTVTWEITEIFEEDGESPLVLDVRPGDVIEDVCKEAVVLAIRENRSVEFRFNGIRITVGPESDPDRIAGAYYTACERREVPAADVPGHRRDRRLARRDKRIAGLERKIQRLERALALRTLDLESLSRNIRAEVQNALCNVRMIPVGGPHRNRVITEVRNIPENTNP